MPTGSSSCDILKPSNLPKVTQVDDGTPNPQTRPSNSTPSPRISLFPANKGQDQSPLNMQTSLAFLESHWPEIQDPLLTTRTLLWTGPPAYGRELVSTTSVSSSSMWQVQDRWCTCTKRIICVHHYYWWESKKLIRTCAVYLGTWIVHLWVHQVAFSTPSLQEVSAFGSNINL